MIPTRLSQKFHDGSVVGFSSGSVIVAYQTVYYSGMLDFSKLDNINDYYGFASSVQYKLPSINECAVALAYLFKNQVTPITGITSDNVKTTPSIGSFFNTNCFNNTAGSKKWITQIKLDYTDCEYKSYRAAKFFESMSSGFTLPVLLINGDNCDSY